MKRTFSILIALLLAASLLLSACTSEGDPIETDGSENTLPLTEESATDETTPVEDQTEESETAPEEDPNTVVTYTESYLPDSLFSRLRVLFESKSAPFNTYSTGNVPYVIRDVYTISDCRLTSISIPVAKTLNTDKNGNFTFTISVFDNSYEGLKRSPKREYSLKISAEKYNLSANASNIYRFIDVPLEEYDIVLSENETIGFFAVADTLYPAYLPTNAANDNPAFNLVKLEYPEATGFFQKVGTADLSTSINSLFYNLEWERTRTLAEIQAEESEAERMAEIIASLKERYEGKYLSILGDSISTFNGISNNTAYNSTIGSNAVWYPNSNSNFINYSFTYWGRLMTDLNMKLCVNNSWSGSRVYYDDATKVDMLERSTELDNDNGTPNDPTDDIAPDVILIYLGINDLHNNSKFGNLAELLKEGDNPHEVVEGWLEGISASDWCSTYALSLQNIVDKYPNAEIYCMTLIQSHHANATAEKIEQYNLCIKALASYFGAEVIDQQADGELTFENCHTYGSDVTALHPNPQGHELMEKLVLETMYKRNRFAN